MFWSFANDRDGSKMRPAIAPLLSISPTDPPTNPPTDPPTNPPTDPPTNPPTDPPTNPPTDPPTNPPTNPPSGPIDPQPSPGTAVISRPIRFGYQDGIRSWWPAKNLLAGLGLPGVSPKHVYNYFSLNLWTMAYGAQHLGIVWQNPLNSFGSDSGYGITNQ